MKGQRINLRISLRKENKMTKFRGDLGIKRTTTQMNMILKCDMCYEGEAYATMSEYTGGWSTGVVKRVRKSL